MTPVTPAQVEALMKEAAEFGDHLQHHENFQPADLLYRLASALAALRDENAALRKDAEKLTNDVRWVHQKLKRGERTQDHGLKGNLACIIDHLAEEGLT